MSYGNKSTGESLAVIAVILFAISVFAAWVTHIVVCLSTAKWGFLIAGAIMAPIGVIHGYGIWFGWF